MMYRDDMMDGAVSTQSHSFDSNYADTNDLSRRLSKKRRLDERPGHLSLDHPLDGWSPAQQQQYAPNIHASPVALQKYPSDPHNIAYASSAHVVSGSTALAVAQTAPLPLTSNAYSGQPAHTYCEVTPYGQPYYDSVAYASSWPPVGSAQPALMGGLAGSIYPHAELDSMHYDHVAHTGFPAAPIHALPVRPGIPIMADQTGALAIEPDSALTQMLSHSLPTLESLALQLIRTVVQNDYAQLLALLHDDLSEAARSFRILKFNFEQTRHMFIRNHISRDAPFISSISLPELDSVHQDSVRKANIATFILAILDPPSGLLPLLHEFFPTTFLTPHHKLVKWQGVLLVELKTQAYIAALQDRHVDNPLDIYFPLDPEAALPWRYFQTPGLSPADYEFVERCQARRQLLTDETRAASFADLTLRYPWNHFVGESIRTISGNMNGLLSLSARILDVQQGTDVRRRETGSAGSPPGLAAVGDEANDGLYRTGSHGASPSLDARKPTSTGATVRQPWTKPEEEALLEGLERVNGPHWSQILALYGRGGSVNEVLKDRNQVQLKDKARNLKLWHLKLGKEVPNNLKGVTGELRKRGGARARAALEAEAEERSAGTRRK